MSTKAQVKANRKNSKKSTGPRSRKGKAAVAQNAVTHGLCAAEAVIRGEDPEDFEDFRAELLAELAPVGVVESILAERAASLSWRLQRAERIQNQAIDHAIEQKVTNPVPKSIRFLDCEAQGIPLTDARRTSGHLPLGRIVNSDWPVYKMLERLSLYERRIESSLFRTLKELERRRLIRELQQADAAEGLPKRATGLQSAEDMAKAAKRRRKKRNLKKQSQFGGDSNVSPAMKRYCEERWWREMLEYEAKQRQFQAPTPESAARAEEPQANIDEELQNLMSISSG
jgi:hypothetical protein